MWQYQVLLIVILSVLCFYTRIVWRLRYPYFGNDTWYHLTAAKAIRENGFRPPVKTGLHFNKSNWDYPPFLPYLLATFSSKKALRLSGFVPSIFDTLSCFIVGVLASWLPVSGLLKVDGWVTFFGLNVADSTAILLPLMGMLIWTFTPMTCIDAFQHLSPRPIGNLWMAMTIALMFLFQVDHSWLYLLPMLVPVTLIYLTHKFTLQALTLLNIGLFMFTREPWFLLVQLVGLLLAFSVTGGWYFKVLKGQLAFLNYYRKEGAEKYPGKYSLGHERLMKILKLDTTGNPWLYFLIPVLLFGPWPPSFLTAAAITMAGSYLLTSLNPLLFLGEPERYFETAVLPLAISVPLFILVTPAPFLDGLWLLLFAIILLLGAMRIYREMRGREEQMSDNSRVIEHHVDREWLEACEFMKRHPGKRIITVAEYFQFATAYFSGKQTQGIESAIGYGDYMDEFPATPKNIRRLVTKYKVDMVFMAKASSEGFNMDFATKVFENGRYIVYDTRGFRKRRKAFD